MASFPLTKLTRYGHHRQRHGQRGSVMANVAASWPTWQRHGQRGSVMDNVGSAALHPNKITPARSRAVKTPYKMAGRLTYGRPPSHTKFHGFKSIGFTLIHEQLCVELSEAVGFLRWLLNQHSHNRPSGSHKLPLHILGSSR